MRRSHSNFNRAIGFTLVELLVVIGIIAMLISVLLPALAAARSAAQTTSCLAQLRNLGQAVAIYRAEFKGFYPPIAQWNKGNQNADTSITWNNNNSYQGYNLWGILKVKPNSYTAVCPTVRSNLPQPVLSNTTTRAWFSYKYNWFVAGSEGGMSYKNRGVPGPSQIAGATAGYSTPTPYKNFKNDTQVMLFMDYPQFVAYQTDDMPGSDRGILRLPAFSASVTGLTVNGENHTVFHQVAPVHGKLRPTGNLLVSGAKSAPAMEGLINVAYCDGSARTVPVKQGMINSTLTQAPQVVLDDTGNGGAISGGSQAVIPDTRLMPYLAP